MRIALFIGFLLCVISVNAQLDPVKWTFESEKVSDTEYDIIFTAQIEEGWSVYSPYLESNDGPIPTSFEFYNKDLEAIGKAKEEGNRKEMFDELFEMNLIKFSKKARFIQRVKVNHSNTVTGHLTYMTCDDERCLPPKDVNFEISLID